MKTQHTALLLAPLPALGYVYTGVGGGGRQLLELTSVTVDVQIDERVARTRTDQVFTNRADRVVEGIYEFTLPEGAIITDLVLWIGDKRVQGIIMEKETARRVYDAIVRRRIDPALIEQVTGRKLEKPRMSVRSCRSVVAVLEPPHLNVPGLRHTVASHAVMSGENLPLVGKLLGHRRHRTTAGYSHLADGHLVEAAENVGSIIAEAMADVDARFIGPTRP